MPSWDLLGKASAAVGAVAAAGAIVAGVVTIPALGAITLVAANIHKLCTARTAVNAALEVWEDLYDDIPQEGKDLIDSLRGALPIFEEAQELFDREQHRKLVESPVLRMQKLIGEIEVMMAPIDQDDERPDDDASWQRWLAKTTAHGERKSELPKLQAQLTTVKADLTSAIGLVTRWSQTGKLRKMDSNSAAFEYNPLDCKDRLTGGHFSDFYSDKAVNVSLLENWATTDAEDVPQYAMMIAMGEVYEVTASNTCTPDGTTHLVARPRGDRRVVLRKVFDEDGNTVGLELGFQAAVHGDNDPDDDKCAPMECIALTELTQFRRCALGSDEELSVIAHDQEDAAKLCYVLKASPDPRHTYLAADEQTVIYEPTVVLQFAGVEGISAELFELIVYRALSCPEKTGTMNVPDGAGGLLEMQIPAGLKQWNFEADDEKLRMHSRDLPYILTADEKTDLAAIDLAAMRLRTPMGQKSASRLGD